MIFSRFYRCPDPIYRDRERGKSGQHRAPYFLTGRSRRKAGTASATENNRPELVEG